MKEGIAKITETTWVCTCNTTNILQKEQSEQKCSKCGRSRNYILNYHTRPEDNDLAQEIIKDSEKHSTPNVQEQNEAKESAQQNKIPVTFQKEKIKDIPLFPYVLRLTLGGYVTCLVVAGSAFGAGLIGEELFGDFGFGGGAFLGFSVGWFISRLIAYFVIFPKSDEKIEEKLNIWRYGTMSIAMFFSAIIGIAAGGIIAEQIIESIGLDKQSDSTFLSIWIATGSVFVTICGLIVVAVRDGEIKKKLAVEQ